MFSFVRATVSLSIYLSLSVLLSPRLLLHCLIASSSPSMADFQFLQNALEKDRVAVLRLAREMDAFLEDAG